MGENIEHPKPTISSPKATNIPVVTFKWDFRTPPLPQPRRGQAWHAQQGSAKFRELELDISLLAAGNIKNPWKINIWVEEFFFKEAWTLNPLFTVRSPQSTVHSLYVVRFDASCIV